MPDKRKAKTWKAVDEVLNRQRRKTKNTWTSGVNFCMNCNRNARNSQVTCVSNKYLCPRCLKNSK